MFEWKVEDMALRNERFHVVIGREKIYSCETNVSREDKIEFVDRMEDGKLSYLLSLIEKFNVEKDYMPKDKWGNVKTASLMAWVKRNDTKYENHIIDTYNGSGKYYILGSQRYIQGNSKGAYDVYDSLVDECFHRQLKKCECEERNYFLEHDEYSILKKKFEKRMSQYNTTFGVDIITGSCGVCVGDFNRNREITIEELKEMLSKYEQLDALVGEITLETHIVY